MLYKSYITILVLLVATVSSALPAALELGDEILPNCIVRGGIMCCRRYCYDPTVDETVVSDHDCSGFSAQQPPSSRRWALA
ncbi:hypothetical protein BGZ72_009827 [Mortierella alpina]|nr:hypothetical protein BGZ72_009827 [Mortierella alpina]